MKFPKRSREEMSATSKRARLKGHEDQRARKAYVGVLQKNIDKLSKIIKDLEETLAACYLELRENEKALRLNDDKVI